MISIFGWLATILILLGYYLNARKLTISWIVWFVGNVSNLIYSGFIEAWPQFVLAIALMGLNVYGYIEWKKKN